ncbi:MAG: hypothetical protein CR993_09250 [Rhodobacterales bacterium]|nr:MAG: hypothetical protein CR993_09250 [Rhodobacterales bacterium]
MSGLISYLNGKAAEDNVEAEYGRRGMDSERKRFRGGGGEIDLILRDGEGFVFVEVKRARDFARAAARLSMAQFSRIQRAALAFVANQPKGMLTEMRFDLALVDEAGRCKIIENVMA